MRNLKALFFFLLIILAKTTLAQQQDPVVLEYINTYKDIAISEMQRTGVPAAIKLAQGIHETGAGQSKLVLKSNNHFGIKCKSDWKGESVKHTDDAPNECFRKYDTPEESYIDHSDFLKNSQRYASLFELDPTNYSGWAKGLKKAGYATNPKYPQIIINLIETYNLQDYTMIALGKKLNEGDEQFVKEAEKKIDEVVSPVVRDAVAVNYPTGEFKINETKVVWVTKGTSFLAIANKYNISLSRLFEFNDMLARDFSEKDQLVYLQRKRKTGAQDQYVVREGETLLDISQLNGIRLESLLAYNHLKADMLPKAGSILYLR